MNRLIETIRPLCGLYATPAEGLRVDVNPTGSVSMWMQLVDSTQFLEFATRMQEVGCRLATATVDSPDQETAKDRREITYNFMLEELPLTVKVIVEESAIANTIVTNYEACVNCGETLAMPQEGVTSLSIIGQEHITQKDAPLCNNCCRAHVARQVAGVLI
ncbi:hypothetical protein [Pseudovibrio sp. POLY-S9]|uniref:hypothetical protein n=1 Tax=Pseudovibrio sp. POLY-S9 TaxID=1576596 RepID=UPI0007103199|nr:hypothetical protein [Pseudovibrio sp. POLY-S9]